MTATLLAGDHRMDLSGRVTAENVIGLRRQGEAWLAGHQADAEVWLDVSGVGGASSVLLSLLLCWRRESDRLGVSLHLCGVQDVLMKLSQLNGVSRWLTVPA